jgi:hypothetical protein
LEDTQQIENKGCEKEVEIEDFLSIGVYKENNPRRKRSRFLV